MYYPYEEVEEMARRYPPPPPPENDEFPTMETVIALYLLWLLLFGREFEEPEVIVNGKQTILRVGRSKLISQLHYKWKMAYAKGG